MEGDGFCYLVNAGYETKHFTPILSGPTDPFETEREQMGRKG